MLQRNLQRRLIDGVMGRAPQARPRSGPQWVPTRNRIGISVSGGGIRSASYCLGALQALQERGVLQKADYLTSVSGGGYIAGAMTMMATSEPRDLVSPPYPASFARGSPEEDYLRNHSSYLAPDGAGLLRLFLRIVLGLLINLLFLATILVPFGRASGLLGDRIRGDVTEPLAAALPMAWVVMVGLFIVGVACLFLTALRRLGGEQDRFVAIAYAFLVPSAVMFLFFVAIPQGVEGLRHLTKSLGGAIGFFESILGTSGGNAGASGVSRLFTIAATLGLPALVGGTILGVLKKKGASIALFVAGLIAPTLIVLFVLAVANDAITPPRTMVEELGWFGGSAVVFLTLNFFGDLTASSLHPFYKRRLSSAFALGRRKIEGKEPPEDIGAVERPYTEPISLTTTDPEGRRWPIWVACAAANINDEGLTPPGRKAVSFTFDCEWIGGPKVGYIPTPIYELIMGGERAEDVSVPAAIAISGAALSPSMGVMTKPSLTFLLALINARLGVWLPNPRLIAYLHQKELMKELEGTSSPSGSAPPEVTVAPRRRGPRANFTWLIRELLGMNKGKASFLYVTDGGHWENLGLVELLRRGCTEVYCFDAAGDKEDTFFTLGQAISMARSELGVEIDLDPDDILPEVEPDEGEGGEPPNYSSTDHVYGTFEHTLQTPRLNGRIVFAKAAVVEDAPWDVRAYKLKDPQFPNHSLLAQMFADQTFESYRRLGYKAGQDAMTTMERKKRARSRSKA